MSVSTFTKTGNKAATPAKLPKGIFDVEVKNHDLLKQAYVGYLSNGRTNNGHVLKRGEVRGGGKKPWRQKGTGRARFGSIRVPIWRGGGITFGPTGDENYAKAMPVKTKRAAICQALTSANKAGKISIIESFDVKDGKAANAASLLNKIGATKRTLLVVADKDNMLKRATANIKDLKVVQARYLSVYDVLAVDMIVITAPALEMIEQWLGGKK